MKRSSWFDTSLLDAIACRWRFAALLFASMLVAPFASNAQTPVTRITLMMSGDPAEKAAYDTLVGTFTAKFPQIDVQIINVPGSRGFHARLSADIQTSNPPDVTLINYRRYGAFARRNAFVSLDSYLANSKVIKKTDFFAEAMEPFHWEDRLLCLPQNISSLVVYYNKNLFKSAGIPYPSNDWNWNDFVNTAKALTKDTDGDGKTDQFGLGTEASFFRVAPFVWQHGGELVDRQKYPRRLVLMMQETQEAVQWFVDLQLKHKVVPDAAAEKSENSESRFQNGRLGMFLNSRRGVPAYRTISAFEWDVAPLPQGKNRVGLLHADGFCISSKSANKDAAWSFIEYANSPEGQTVLAKTGRTVPSLKSVASSPAFLDANASPSNSKVFIDGIPYIRSVPVTEGWPDIEEIAGKEVERAMFGQASVPEALATAISRTDKYFGED